MKSDSTTICEGVVYRKILGQYDVLSDGELIPCQPSPRLRKELVYPTASTSSRSHRVQKVNTIEHYDPVAVGDRVKFSRSQDGPGVLIEVLPRCTKLARRTAVPMPGAHPFEQVIAANIDQVVPVFAAAQPDVKWNMLDRYLVSAESLELPSVIVINKTDLLPDGSAQILHARSEYYSRIGYPVIYTSTVTGEGVDTLKIALAGKISVLAGKSGVGKTSLLNALQPGLGARVGQVSQLTGKGKHTTTHMEMFPIGSTGAIVDTPGVREFGLWDVEQHDLALFFPEMRPMVGHCKFGLNCMHQDEPGCVIRRAVMSEQISPYRYQSYLRLLEDGYFA
jgi:ribosome biogenesis GTPase